MERAPRNGEAECGIVARQQDLVNVRRLGTTEQNEPPARRCVQTPVHLYGQPVCFIIGDEIVVLTDTLARRKFVCDGIDPVSQFCVQNLFDPRPKGPVESRLHEKCQSMGQCNIP